MQDTRANMGAHLKWDIPMFLGTAVTKDGSLGPANERSRLRVSRYSMSRGRSCDRRELSARTPKSLLLSWSASTLSLIDSDPRLSWGSLWTSRVESRLISRRFMRLTTPRFLKKKTDSGKLASSSLLFTKKDAFNSAIMEYYIYRPRMYQGCTRESTCAFSSSVEINARSVAELHDADVSLDGEPVVRPVVGRSSKSQEVADGTRRSRESLSRLETPTSAWGDTCVPSEIKRERSSAMIWWSVSIPGYNVIPDNNNGSRSYRRGSHSAIRDRPTCGSV